MTRRRAKSPVIPNGKRIILRVRKYFIELTLSLIVSNIEIAYLINIYEAVILIYTVFCVERCKTLILRAWRAKMRLGDAGKVFFKVKMCLVRRVAKTSFPLVRTNRCHFPLPWRGNVVLARHFYLSSREYQTLPVYRTDVQSIIRRAVAASPASHLSSNCRGEFLKTSDPRFTQLVIIWNISRHIIPFDIAWCPMSFPSISNISASLIMDHFLSLPHTHIKFPF